eukprot:g7703.t1
MHPYPQRVCLRGQEAELFKLVSYGATPEQWAEWLRVPLEHAVACGNLDLVNRLLGAGVSVRAGWRGCRGRTLFDAAAVGGNGEVVPALVRAGAGADVNVVSVSSGRSALYTATFLGHEAAARELVLAGADVNFQDPADKRGVLHAAVRGGHERLVNDLLIGGADVNRVHRVLDGTTPLHVAAEFGFDRIVSSLVLAKAEKNERDGCYGGTPLMLAAMNGHLAAVETLLSAGADLDPRKNDDDTKSDGRDTALHFAAYHGHDTVVAALLRGGAGKDGLDCDGATALMLAAAEGELPAVETLLSASADVHHHSPVDGYTALHDAAVEGHDEILAALLRSGADKNSLDSEGRTPLAVAAANDHLAAVEILLAAGTDLTIRTTDDDHYSAFDTAAMWGHARVVEAFLRLGQDARALNAETGMNALHVACFHRYRGLHDVVDLLLRHGADETALDRDGHRPVHLLDETDGEGEGEDEEELGEEDDEEDDDSPPCTQDEIERTRLLLARAPADRAWRRRAWLLMIRARAQQSKENEPRENTDGVIKRKAPPGAYDEHENTEHGRAGELHQSQHQAGGTAGGGSGSENWGGGGSGQGPTTLPSSVVAMLVEIASEDIFRTAVGFL